MRSFFGFDRMKRRDASKRGGASSGMDEIVVPAFIAVTPGFVVFFLGAFLTRKVAFLGNYNIPEPVSGGLAVSLLTWAFYSFTGQQIVFELEVRDFLLVVFFATIGLNARIADLFRGGRRWCYFSC